MAENTQADLPKKNAAPAEAPKSLQSTIQNVIAKAITSPTDGKIDFAQGVKHITGDPHQKSAGAQDGMQSLKAQAEKEDEKKDVQASYEEKEDKKDMKEAEHDKEDKKKEDMKEGELPAGLKKYLDKKNNGEKKEEKEDEKKDVKEAEDKEKEVKKEMKDDEKKKEMSEAEEKKDEKKVEEKEDEKKKEVSEAEDKEDEKKSAKEKVAEMSMKDDVNALTNDEGLSEEFKQKAATIFESAVKAKLVEEIEKLESEYETKVNEKTEEIKSEIVEKVDAYLNYVVSEWTKENELAIEKGLRTEIAEDFIGGLKNLFESHYIEIPEEKYNVIENQAAEIESLKSKLNEEMEKTVELHSKIGEFARDEILVDVASDLAETEKEKFKGLAENIEYKDAADFRTKVETVKESYFPKKKVVSEDETNNVADKPELDNLSGSMAAYAAAISKTNKK